VRGGQGREGERPCPLKYFGVEPAVSRTHIGHYDAVSNFHEDDLMMLCTNCLELTAENCPQ